MARSRRIVHLQTLRAVAASAAVASHALEYPVRRGILPDDVYRLSWAMGWIAVATFFVISGLIIIRSSHNEFGSSANARKFARRRVVRIVPIYWLMMLPFTAATLARGEQVTAEMILKTMFFIPYYSPEAMAFRPIVGQGWTLNFEMIFYMVFAVSLAFRRSIAVPVVIAIFSGLVAIHILIWPPFPFQDAVSLMQFWTSPLMLLFVIGMLLGAIELRAQHWHSVTYPTFWTLILYTVTVAAFVISGGGFPMPIGWQAVFAISATLTVFLCTSAQSHKMPRYGRFAEIAGDASYSTYLLHPLVLMVFAALWARLPVAYQIPWVFVVISVPACNIAGYVCYRIVERPMTKWLTNLLEGPRTEAPPQSRPA